MELEAMIFETILGFFHKHHYRLGADASGNAFFRNLNRPAYFAGSQHLHWKLHMV